MTRIVLSLLMFAGMLAPSFAAPQDLAQIALVGSGGDGAPMPSCFPGKNCGD